MAANFFSRKLLVGIFSIAAVLSVMSCSSEEDIKYRVLDEIRRANGEDISIDLNRFSKEKILRLCIQTPYLTKEAMEKRVGEEIGGFNEVDDKFFILWIFKDQQTPTQIKFHRRSELNFGEQSMRCISASLVKIVNSKIYLNEKK